MTKFVDTTIQVDRIVESHERATQAAIDAILGGDPLVACSFSRLEFKRVVIQNLSLTLDYLVTEESFFGALNRMRRLRRDRQTKMLLAIMAWVGHSVEGDIEVTAGDGLDSMLRLKAESFIRNAIEFVWYRFDAIVTAVADQTECQRAREAPRQRRTGTFDVAIGESKCRKRQCRNAMFIQERLPAVKKLCSSLEELNADGKLTDELRSALTTLNSAMRRGYLQSLYDYDSCLSVGDVWIHLECAAQKIADFVTTNYKESQVLCPILGLNPLIVTKPPPKKIKKG